MNTGSFSGTWTSESSISTDSDINKKHSIENLGQNYSLFFDSLRPKRYKYKNGTSNRYHTGFIAQEVVEAIESSNLTSTDLAVYVEYSSLEGEKTCGLRYEEFIALNTWQIQKLKPRVSTLEQTILNYEARISNLETEIQNLKNS
jgi:hypothetical protein